ncbi:sodA, partial [Symbiodinium sp. CCMP2456]
MARRVRGVSALVVAALVLVAARQCIDLCFVTPGAGSSTRRGVATTVATGLASLIGLESAKAYDLPDLPYAYDALEPSIDKATMEFHHDKHHLTYVTNINKALKDKKQPPLVELQKTAIKDGAAFRNSGGGAYNHNFFWLEMAPTGTGGAPSEKLSSAIDASFGSMDDFKAKFEAAGAPGARFGSGWVWLVVTADKKLAITSTPNQDNPLMEGVEGTPGIPILGCDVWEHAYYLKYQYRRPDYIKAWWNVVNWKQVSAWYDGAMGGRLESLCQQELCKDLMAKAGKAKPKTPTPPVERQQVPVRDIEVRRCFAVDKASLGMNQQSVREPVQEAVHIENGIPLIASFSFMAQCENPCVFIVGLVASFLPLSAWFFFPILTFPWSVGEMDRPGTPNGTHGHGLEAPQRGGWAPKLQGPGSPGWPRSESEPRLPTVPPQVAESTSLIGSHPTVDIVETRPLPPCFVYNARPCHNGEGIGGMFRRMEWILVLSSKYSCKYVCSTGDWETGGHSTGNVGALFGCTKDRVKGNASLIASRSILNEARLVTASLQSDKSSKHVVRVKNGQALFRGTAHQLSPRPDPKRTKPVVYKLTCPELQTVTHEVSWQWLQAQYNAIRLQEGRPSEWESAAFRIALQLRRGDRPDSCPLFLYLNALRYLFAAVPEMLPQNTEIVVVGELNPGSREFACLSEFPKLKFLAGRALSGSGSSGYTRLRRDLDTIASSNVLIIGGGGSFPSFAATLQAAGGIVLHSRTKDSGVDGLPYAHELDTSGRFKCRQSFDSFTASVLHGGHSGPKSDGRVPGQSEMSRFAEKAVEVYSSWFKTDKPCESKTPRDGFNKKKCFGPNFTVPSLQPCASAVTISVPSSHSQAGSAATSTTAFEGDLYPLEKKYVACTGACKQTRCLATSKDPENRCGVKPKCCGPPGAGADGVLLPHDRVAFVVLRCHSNINHDFHQNFWPLYWWMTLYGSSDTALLVDRRCSNTSYWVDDLFWNVAHAHNWRVYNYTTDVRYCARKQLHILRSVGPCCDYSLKPKNLLHYAKGRIWRSVLGREQLSLQDHSRVLIYTRGKSSWRRIVEPERLKPLFHPRLDISIADDPPATLLEQARFFSSFGAVLAPNGGWSPNVLFMASDSCLIELHLYRRDSWVVDFGLGREIGEVLLIIGDYHDPKKPRIKRPARVGGDDDFLVTGGKDNLFNDISRQMVIIRHAVPEGPLANEEVLLTVKSNATMKSIKEAR